MDRRAAEVAELPAAGTRRREPVDVAHVRVRGLHGRGSPAATAALTIRARAQSSPVSVAPVSARRSASPSEMPVTPGVDAIAKAFSTPSADSTRQWSRSDAAGDCERLVHVVRRLDLRQMEPGDPPSSPDCRHVVPAPRRRG